MQLKKRNNISLNSLLFVPKIDKKVSIQINDKSDQFFKKIDSNFSKREILQKNNKILNKKKIKKEKDTFESKNIDYIEDDFDLEATDHEIYKEDKFQDEGYLIKIPPHETFEIISTRECIIDGVKHNFIEVEVENIVISSIRKNKISIIGNSNKLLTISHK